MRTILTTQYEEDPDWDYTDTVYTPALHKVQEALKDNNTATIVAVMNDAYGNYMLKNDFESTIAQATVEVYYSWVRHMSQLTGKQLQHAAVALANDFKKEYFSQDHPFQKLKEYEKKKREFKRSYK
jgi:hypothetical protein